MFQGIDSHKGLIKLVVRVWGAVCKKMNCVLYRTYLTHELLNRTDIVHKMFVFSSQANIALQREALGEVDWLGN